ncbi:SDR family NAD(P)-dependent oxidoreductase [Leptolyngbya iicbica]|uniref:SDR family NAD(P)-dependent oxidoreductase n=1 Tax=Leptolyngbya iicbica TaxID=3161580 RepID=UPI001F2F724A|nr:SDR family NAD(P)-dependent oxidoreductase [Leptolyngbya sp. LK]
MAQTWQQGNALVVGASQGIGLGFVRHLLADDRFHRVFATYRQPETATDLLALQNHPKLHCLTLEATEEGEVAQLAAKIQAQAAGLDLVVNCVGVLHQGSLQPEKSLRQIDVDQLMQYFQINSVPGILLAKHLQSLLRQEGRTVFANLSAKIGSIEDNRLGGWYGYRASKAALNMLLKTAAIEYGRKNPHTVILALHPGTTDTRLSEPFQRNVPPGKLFSIDRTVTQLLTIIDNATEADNGAFFSWDGSRLPW